MNVYTKKQKFLWQKLTMGIVVLFLCIGFLNFFSPEIKNTFYIAASPLLKIFGTAGESTSGFLGGFLNTKSLNQENNNLKQENQSLLSQISLLQETVKADQATQSVIQNTKEDSFTLAEVRVLGMDTANDFMLINKGSQDGISENMPVISSTKVLFGKVYKVYKNFSQVMLLSNKNSVVDAKIQLGDPTQSPILGVVKGSGNLSLYLDLVSSEEQINPEDTLITSGQEGIFPKDLLIGKIQSTDKNDLKPFQTANLQPFFNGDSIENVFVITDYLKKQ